MLGLTGCYNMS